MPIYTIHVHPDGSRLATGGLGELSLLPLPSLLLLLPWSSSSFPSFLISQTPRFESGPLSLSYNPKWKPTRPTLVFSVRWDSTTVRFSSFPSLLVRVRSRSSLKYELMPPGFRITGSVLCVRWAHHGRYLASGSDDKVVVIWDLDP